MKKSQRVKDLETLAKLIVKRWGKEFDDTDSQISGCDAVDSLGCYVELARQALAEKR